MSGYDRIDELFDVQQREVLAELCQRLREAAPALDSAGSWPAEQIRWCAAAGVFRWFIPTSFGGYGWNEQQILAGYLALSQSCLTTTFVLTQWQAACRRVLASQNLSLQQQLLPAMAAGELFATVGISHLTTSRQHVAQPVLMAHTLPDGCLQLNGYSPWVTAGSAADILVLGATLDDERQVLCAVPARRAGIAAGPGQPLVALTASCTDQVLVHQVHVAPHEILAGPVPDVMSLNSGGGAGGLQTSTLAVGLSLAAVKFLQTQAQQRPDLKAVADKLAADCEQLRLALVDLTAGTSNISTGEVRQRANSLALRTTQAALSAAKGAGFMATHPAGRMAREALFFLVWSCPQPVVAANLCEFAQLS